MSVKTSLIRLAAATLMASTSMLFNTTASAKDLRLTITDVDADASALLAKRHGVPLPKLVFHTGMEKEGDIIINVSKRRLYRINGDGTATEYWIAVGKNNSSPTGVQLVARKAENPYWAPTPNMVRKNRKLKPIAGGNPKNPLGPRAIYIGETFYRIHGTIHPESIGKAESSGCFRMLNDDVVDLFPRVPIGAKVTMIKSDVTPGISDTLMAQRAPGVY